VAKTRVPHDQGIPEGEANGQTIDWEKKIPRFPVEKKKIGTGQTLGLFPLGGKKGGEKGDLPPGSRKDRT